MKPPVSLGGSFAPLQPSDENILQEKAEDAESVRETHLCALCFRLSPARHPMGDDNRRGFVALNLRIRRRTMENDYECL